MIRAVVFDLFETLVTEQGTPKKSIRAVAEELGTDWGTFHPQWRARQRSRYTGECKDFPAALREICTALNHPIAEDIIEKVDRERLHAKAVVFATVEEDIVTMLSQIRHRNVKIGLISNSTPEEVRAWDTCRMVPYFDDVVFSYQVGMAKPDRAIFELAYRQLGVAHEECMFIGDGGSDELRGASEAGMKVYQAMWFVDRQPSSEYLTRFLANTECYPRFYSPLEVVKVLER